MKRFFVLVLLLPWLGCRPAPVSCPERLRVDVGPLEPAQFLSQSIAAAKVAGADAFEPLAGALVSEGEQLGRFVELPTERCIAVFARTGASVRDVDLFVFDDSGDVLAADEAPNSAAAVMVCPPHPKRVYVAARVVSGTGLFAMGAVTVPPAAAEAVARALVVRGRPGEDTGKLAAWPGLERRLRERRAALGSRWEDVRRASLTLDPHATATLSVRVEPQRCLDIFATSSEEIATLSLDVLDREGRVVAHGRPMSAEQALVVCSPSAEELTLALRPRGARGTAAVVVATSPRGAAVELAAQAEVASTMPLLAIESALARHRKRPGAHQTAADGVAEAGRVKAIALEIAPGCTRWDVVGGAPLGRFRVELWSREGELLDRADSGSSAALFACAPKAAPVRLEIVSLGERGPFVVEQTAGPRAPILEAHSRAAARIFQRIEAAAGPVDFGALDGVEVVDASPRHERTITVGEGCAEWFVAADEPRSLLLDAVPLGTRRLGQARGTGLAVLETCAETSAEASLRVSAPEQGTVLLLRR